MTVVVFGSINMDLVVRTPRLPAPAETITGHEFFTAPGGKGANQAVAAARLGAPTRMVGRVGGDAFGQELRQNLTATGADVSAVFTDSTISSGVAVIAVDDQAQNTIIIVPGANGNVGDDDLGRLESGLIGAKVLLLQLEVPLPAVVAAARLAHQHGLTVVLDPAPAQELPAELFMLVDIITPNEVEAGQLVGVAVKTPADAARAARMLLNLGVKTVIIKMGALGVLYAETEREPTFVPAFEVQAVDTVAAGDAFNGGLATALVEGHDLPEAVRWGAAAGALSATKMGAQPSMPGRAEFEAFLKTQAN
ncbi:MAG: ribokinase [Anaerolineae bacterium]|nr:ribokinase [Anaerolineales bacterium]MCQ3977043.1 ribokinase [Anaerolineae bacterium]